MGILGKNSMNASPLDKSLKELIGHSLVWRNTLMRALHHQTLSTFYVYILKHLLTIYPKCYLMQHLKLLKNVSHGIPKYLYLGTLKWWKATVRKEMKKKKLTWDFWQYQKWFHGSILISIIERLFFIFCITLYLEFSNLIGGLLNRKINQC